MRRKLCSAWSRVSMSAISAVASSKTCDLDDNDARSWAPPSSAQAAAMRKERQPRQGPRLLDVDGQEGFME